MENNTECIYNFDDNYNITFHIHNGKSLDIHAGNVWDFYSATIEGFSFVVLTYLVPFHMPYVNIALPSGEYEYIDGGEGVFTKSVVCTDSYLSIFNAMEKYHYDSNPLT